MKINDSVTASRRGFHHAFGARTYLLALGLAFAATATTSPAAAFQSDGNMFVWNDRPAETPFVRYVPNSNFRSNPPNDLLTINIFRRAKGMYSVLLGAPHNALLPSVMQVVAYSSDATDSTHCKFSQSSDLVGCDGSNNNPGTCTEIFVACFTPTGGPADSQFVLQLYATALTGYLPSVDGFIETAKQGDATQLAWNLVAGIKARGPFKIAANTAARKADGTPGDPVLSHVAMGQYRVDFPKLAARPLGTAMVTAIGGGGVRCKLGQAPAPIDSGSTTLRIEINCYDGNSPANSDFVLNYDSGNASSLTSCSACQAAHGYAYDATNKSYTPSRSVNTGEVAGSPGKNTAFREVDSAGNKLIGRYLMRHSTLWEVFSSAYVVAVGSDSAYCKIVSWTEASNGDGTDVEIGCYNYSGKLATSKYMESYQGTDIQPQ